MAKAASEPGISRVDQESKKTHGWFVRLTIEGRQLSRFFSDGSFGGKNKALQAAKDHRDRVKVSSETKSDIKFGDAFLIRMEYARVRGWQVRVPNPAGGLLTRLFSDSLHGGADNAKVEASRWRDTLVLHYGLEDRAAEAAAIEEVRARFRAARAKTTADAAPAKPARKASGKAKGKKEAEPAAE